ncbi:DUF4179 domain-containing protein [Virgibacillus sp. MSP4-1]|uniref:DUF4179 domain-containing protein n=1 Tax=Virgibacillus sp. MSP4-1 TaxID=2700081 RepID=UPI0003A15901|nr:DUF4179 domain-containing protein [Virgibacillus sp. MSP4-1]QHS24209.1 DUF4179 domain-containing protein [Virgibacillus sp. MSP4-1]
MFEKEEAKLNTFKEKYSQEDIPSEALDDAIFTGFQKAKASGRPPKAVKRWVISAAAVAVLLISLIGSIRISPAFAQYMTSIPGMEKIVELIRDDKGMMSAIKNDHYHEIGTSVHHNGVKITLDGIIADQKGFVLFYTLEDQDGGRPAALQNVRLKTPDGKQADYGSLSMSNDNLSDQDEYDSSGTIEVFFEEPYETKEFVLHTRLRSSAEEVEIQFTVPEELPAEKTYEINKEIVLDGQRINVLDVTVNPIRTAIKLKEDSDNAKKILAYEDVKLVDERGETWGKIMNGVSASRTSDHTRTIYMQSNYFHEPEELYLLVNKLQAVNRNESEVVIDMEEENILKQPDGNKLRNLQVDKGALKVELHTEKEFYYSIFSTITGANGKQITAKSSMQYGYEERGFSQIEVISNELSELKSPVSLELAFFPEWIEGKEKIQVK